MRLTVDEHLCGTTGQCALIAPEVFRQRADGIAEVIDADPPSAHRAAAHDAMHSCPVGAIFTEES